MCSYQRKRSNEAGLTLNNSLTQLRTGFDTAMVCGVTSESKLN